MNRILKTIKKTQINNNHSNNNNNMNMESR